MIWPRLLIAAPLLAAPVWAGAAGRSYWLLPVLIAVFSVAYLDGKHRIWREAFIGGGAADKAKAVAGAALSQTVLVSLLFFAAAGLSVALGGATDRAPFGRLDAGVAALVLAVSLLGGAVVRWAEGGRDPVDRALDGLKATLEDLDGVEDDELPLDDEDADPFLALESELDSIAERFLVSETEIESLAARFADADGPLRVASHLTHLARNPDPETDSRVGASHRLRVVYRGMRRLWVAEAEVVAEIYAASFEALILSTLKSGDAALRMETLALADAMGLRGDRLMAALRAIESEGGLADESGQALKRRAARLFERLETP